LFKNGFGVAEVLKAIVAVVAASTAIANPAEGKIFLQYVRQHIVNHQATG
jgi:hypothetical protein